MLEYLNIRGMSPGPLFKFDDGRPLTRQLFVEAVRKGLRLAGVNQDIAVTVLELVPPQLYLLEEWRILLSKL